MNNTIKEGYNMEIKFRKLRETDFDLLFIWCLDKEVYEWFEQKPLSPKEITNKYKKKLEEKKQELLIISIDDIDIGFTQIYKYEQEKNIYEFDILIGNKEYRNKGYGLLIINEINNYIHKKYKAKAIVLRPFKRNTRAIKCYKKCGYKLVKEYDDKNTIGEDEIVCLLMHEFD